MASYEQPSQPPEVVEFGLPLIQDATVQGLGETALICLYPERVKGMYTGRWHQQHTVELDGHKHSVLVTNPSAHYSQTDVYFFPGFTQTTDEPGGGGFKVHTELAKRLPHERVVSIASTGIGRFGDRVHYPTRHLATVESMAMQRLRLLQAIGGDRRKQLATLSMGTVIGNRLSQLDLDNDMNLGITANVKFVPAIVAPDRITKDMICGFGLHIVPDVQREIFDRRNCLDPRRLLATVRSLSRLGLGLADLPALGTQLASLTNGTEPALVDNECGNYPVRVIAGGRDPLTQPAMWEAEQTAHPSNVSLTIIAGRGHGMAADSVGAARAFSRTLSIMDTAA